MNSTRAVALAAITLVCAALTVTAGASAAKSNVCPNGKVRFGVEPYDSGPKFTGAYQALTKALQTNLGCPVKLTITNNYTAEVEAMRAKQLDVAEFGPLGYIFAHKLAKAQPVAVFGTADHKPVTYTAALWVPASSSITTVAQLKGHTVAFSDPASTSGNLLPRYAMIKAGLNPDTDVTVQFAGSHSASLLALTNGKVDAGEVNSQQQATASAAGQFDPSKFRVIWRSAPIPNDPITVRGDLPSAFRTAFKSALLKLTPAQLQLVDTELGVDSGPMIPGTDAMYQPIRDVVSAENLQIKDIG
ncbi:MAG TPA: phosphate/phosphite/phosphonate ABC transporter substrate-binding protein [Gaiellaceae bacterium]|nr:phosphate/phosphite/phosphonate ABC transporter substrate-binding protein [Gaiellaceae bacterium]